MIDENKFYFLSDAERFISHTSANKQIAPILQLLGPVKMTRPRGDNVYNIFETLDGTIMTGDTISTKYGFSGSFHITEREASCFKPVPGDYKAGQERPVPIVAIPEIRLTITTLEEVHAAIVMLQGLKDASV